ncbi:MAG TPA: urea ABC transporter permease subunit UrtB, partial [Nitrospiria bacterium]|nr:urea ABC transporter permease subunit UrtB [Nitrospiria bacterium]
ITLREGRLARWQATGALARVVITGANASIEAGARVAVFGIDGQPLTDERDDPITVDAASLVVVEADRGVRRAVKGALDRLELFSPDPAVRQAAATRLGREGGLGVGDTLAAALARESEPNVRRALDESVAFLRLADPDPSLQVEAARTLGALRRAAALPQLRELKASSDAGVAAAATEAVTRIERWELFTRAVEIVFSGLSLSSILLLMALGLAVTFGLMGVINMAHGELMMLGAYTTFVVQEIFVASFAPELRDWYFVVSLPTSFVAAALFGIVLERSVIRFLYGRPLETLLATWGVSLILQQGARQIFGAANVDVASPAWLSGGLPVVEGVYLPYNRLFIVGLTIACVAATALVLFRTSTGLKIRAVTQNRDMSACLGVRTRRVDTWTFAFGAGLAGLAGCALTLIGNVGPDLGQHYIVQSFMVVVAGGVGKLVGTIAAAVSIGGLDKFLEPALGAVYGQVLILALLIVFLQRRPAGLFPAKGRHVDV